MEYNVRAGMTNEVEYVVSKDDTTSHFSKDCPVFATPVMINWIEQTSLKLCQQVLPEGYDTVGTFVNVKHMAPTPLGMKVRVCVEVAEVNGKLLTFNVKVYDERNKVAEGTHGRAIVNVARFVENLKK
ncbi:thioesterase family protein [Lachnospiraceae bacterium NSJ-143]|nr:thioesterase family protein [Lachnospiraceae bacterium NSJ-143]